MNRTYIRKINNLIVDKIFIFALIKRIVTFYYNSFIFHPNIFKNYKKMSTNISEHKNCLALIKAAGNSNINFIY